MPEAASTGMIARFANATDEFRQHYDRLADVRYGAAIARLGDNQLMHDYGKELIAAERLQGRIEAVTGAWQNIKEWSGLAAIPLIPLAIVAGLTTAIFAGITTIRAFMKRADIRLAIQQDPTLTYQQAADQVEREQQGTFGKALDVAQLGIYALIAFLAYQLFSRR